ncbi:hypothetical protein VNO80_31668 [Phaseolus coccineus]|uniref:Uncharacterized protein n=1 Tax=Phaseolus coccineus TaxID=3886 RepID=A0AAN9L5L1_PHACN
MSTQKKCIYLYKSGFCILDYYGGGVLLNHTPRHVESLWLGAMHPPSRCACFVVKASHNAHCMVDPPTWVGVTHGGAGSGGRCRFRPTFNLVRENVMCSCGTLVGFGVWLISTLVSTKSGVWLLTVRGKGAIMSGL